MIAVDDGFIDDLSVGVDDCCKPAAAVVDLVSDEPRLSPVGCSSLDDKLRLLEQLQLLCRLDLMPAFWPAVCWVVAPGDEDRDESEEDEYEVLDDDVDRAFDELSELVDDEVLSDELDE